MNYNSFLNLLLVNQAMVLLRFLIL